MVRGTTTDEAPEEEEEGGEAGNENKASLKGLTKQN